MQVYNKRKQVYHMSNLSFLETCVDILEYNTFLWDSELRLMEKDM